MIDRDQANRDALKACAVLGLFFVALAAGAYVWRLDFGQAIPRDGSSLVVGRDFLNFWMYGRAAWHADPGAWYYPFNYAQALAPVVGDTYPGQNWSYPPTLMMLMAPFGRLEYLTALALWTALGLALFVPVLRRYLTDSRALVAVLCSPAAVFGLISGQVSFATTAMLVGAFVWLDKKPVSAGILIGFLTLKPHVGLLLPFMLVASGRWTVFAVATATAVALFGLSVALFGVQPWIDYLKIGLPVQNLVMSDPDGIATPFFPTLFGNLRGIGIGYAPALSFQVALAIAATALVIWAFRYRRNADPRLLAALFFACSLAALPYVLLHDTLPLCVGAMALLAAGLLDARGRALARLVFWLPLLQIGLGTFAIPGPALIAPAFALCIFLQLRNASVPRAESRETIQAATA